MRKMSLKQLKKNTNKEYLCPECGNVLHYVDGGAVRVVDGKVDMENIKPKYECNNCGVYYREVLTSGYFDVFSLESKKEHTAKKKRKIRATGDLQPMELTRDKNGHCPCPRCGADMRFVEGQPVRIVHGKLDMENGLAHFICDECASTYRRIANTNFYQWYEK